jgi:Ca2+-transporting ATPase
MGDDDLSKFFTIFAMLHIWNLFNVRCWDQVDSVFSSLQQSRMFLSITFALFLGQAAITQWGGPLFRVVPLAGPDWMKIVTATSVVLWIGELWRLSLRMASGDGTSGAEGS